MGHKFSVSVLRHVVRMLSSHLYTVQCVSDSRSCESDLYGMPRRQQVAGTSCVTAQVLCTGMVTCKASAACQQRLNHMNHKSCGSDLCDMPWTQQVVSLSCAEAQVMCTRVVTGQADAACPQALRLRK